VGSRNPGSHWKRRSHRGGEEDDTEEDLTKELDDSSANPALEESSGAKNGTLTDTEIILHLHLGHLADAFIQMKLQYIAVVHKDRNRAGFKHS